MNGPVACRGCGAPETVMVLDLGLQPLANRYLDEAALQQPEPTFPLSLHFCPECSLVQIGATVDPEVLFGDYLYLSSASDAFVARASELADRLTEQFALSDESLVVEIGSNDGYLLQHYQAQGVPVLGVEPSTRIAQIAVERGVPTHNDFFSEATAGVLRKQHPAGADVIHANNVLAHVPDIHDVLRGVATLLAAGGRFVVETPYVRDLVDRLQFDTIYHEHVFAYSLTALSHLFAANGLRVVDVERIDVHGGSLRVYGQHAEADSGAAPTEAVTALLAEEEAAGLLDAAYYRLFASRVEALGEELRAVLTRLRMDGQRIAAYGAAAKGTVLLNAFGIGPDLVDYVVDRNELKCGRWMPRQHLPIRPVETLLDDMPDVVLLLAWNVAGEVIRQQDEYVRRGGRFLLPVPAPRFVP